MGDHLGTACVVGSFFFFGGGGAFSSILVVEATVN